MEDCKRNKVKIMTEGKILVTGAAGFIGFHLCNLLKDSYRVIGIDNLNDYYDVNLKFGRLRELGIDEVNFVEGNEYRSAISSNLVFIKCDLVNKALLNTIFEKNQFDYVINLAAQAGVRYSLSNPQAYIDSNISGFLNILECSRLFRIKHLVYASSSSVYGTNETMPFKESDPVDHPISLYAVSKRTNELMAHTYSHIYDLPTTGLRFFTVYGPWGRPDMALFLFAKAIMESKPIDVYNNGEMLRDFTYVEDIVNSINLLIKKIPGKIIDTSQISIGPNNSKAPFKIFNIGNSNPEKLLFFIAELEKSIGKKAIKNLKEIQPGDVPATWSNSDSLYSTIDFKPNTSISNGINHFVEWFLSFYNHK